MTAEKANDQFGEGLEFGAENNGAGEKPISGFFDEQSTIMMDPDVMDDGKAVSYTHLTLPTICSV